MGTSQFTSSKQICENLLVEGQRYNVEHSILPSENAVADRLLARGVELTEAYEELHRKLHGHPHALQTFLGIVLSTAAFWGPEKISEARAARDELAKVNQEVAKKAVELADLLQQRSDLHDISGFSSNTHYNVCEAIESAARGNYLFESYVQGPLEALRTRFDLKYWPTLSDVLRELASDAEAAITEATNPLTAAATVASRASLADFFKALFASIEENRVGSYGHLPKDFKATDSTLAILANCALDLSTDESVDGPYVKRLRQRERFGTR
ncbi:hypothetical protein LBW62_23095 [Ralstonia solanacearum]|uniref:hypothetical protein n=1 Tax=Ralstonia solanacearum TaxID=305 RepID=UPI0005C525C3|nr:hypothetical protein [Ralstonia solanacearum]MDB0544141.1 hypothetical protein [Ralstonia solanacearum]MDB0553903.1 hypothetical protein [Ralstonia solanacearum]MDB0559064.1 hypothetical protein [Ralstonia solanacearum]